MPSLRPALAALVAALAGGCGLVVVDASPDPAAPLDADAGGGGAAPAPPAAPPDVCPGQCDLGTGQSACSCLLTCDGLSRIACHPTVSVDGEPRIECVCTLDEVFSGICIETDTGALCDRRRGCCRKYFSL